MCTEAYSDFGRKSKGNPKFTSSLGRLNKGYLCTLKRSCIWSMFKKRRTFFIKKVLCLVCRGSGNYAQSMTHPLASVWQNIMSYLGIIKIWPTVILLHPGLRIKHYTRTGFSLFRSKYNNNTN